MIDGTQQVFFFSSSVLLPYLPIDQEYVRPGMRMLFRDGRVRGVGLITSVPPPIVQPAH
jgi:hypothetical protein